MSDGKVVFDITGNTAGIHSALNSATNTIAQQTAKWTVLGQTAMNGLVSAAKAGFDGIKALAKNAFEYNASMETYEVNFKTLLGSAEKAQAKMVELKEYAAKTPFAFADLADATQTLLAFGVSSDDASLALKHLGDISLGDANRLNSLALAFGQVSSAGKLAGQDLLQMINAGFNPLQVIAEETGAAYADLKAVMSGEKTSEDFQLRMEAARREVEELGVNASQSAIMLAKIGEDGIISADMVAAAMRIATSEGGAFYMALENASTTAKGQISTIQDSWDMLTGKMFGGIFDNLSQNTLPKIISWLDELNAAFDENGFTGLKTAAGRVFEEIGGMAFDAGAGFLTKLYNGITGDTKTTEEVKAYLSEIFGAASDAIGNIKDVGVGFLEWIRDNGELVGAAATTIGIGLGVFATLSNPLAGILTALAGALLLFTTDWETFEAKYPNIVAAFENITGIEFDAFIAGVEGAKTNLSAFYNDALVPLFEWLSANGEAVQLAIAGIGVAMMLMGAPVAGLSLLLGVVIANWKDIKTAVDNAVSVVNTFFTQTIPDSWNQLVANVKQGWQEHVCTPLDESALKIAAFFGLQLPENWSLTSEIGKAWDAVIGKIQGAINKVNEFIGIVVPQTLEDWQDMSDHYAAPEPFYNFKGWSDHDMAAAVDYIKAHAQVKLKGDQSYAYMRENATVAILQGQGEEAAASFATAVDELFASIETGEPVQIPAEWMDGTDTELQAALSGMNLSVPVSVNPVLNRTSVSGGLFSLINGWFGQDHATGGVFTSATRFLGEDGMHTFGESGTEALLPLDTLWRKMGFTFDQAFAANLDSLQYAIMPQLPAASPVSFDEDKLGETVAAAIKEAISGITVELDKRKVGKIIAPEVSHEIANEVNGRKWTA